MENTNCQPLISPGYFGKLPMYGEYVSYNHFDAIVHEFDRFIQDGLNIARLELGSHFGSVFQRMPILKCFYSLAESSQVLVTVVRASRDREGRQYPIAIELSVDVKNSSLSYNRYPFLCFEPFYTTIAEIIDVSLDKLSIEFFKESLQGNSNWVSTNSDTLVNEYKNYVKQISICLFFESVFGNKWRDKLGGLLINLFEGIAPFAGSQDFEKVPATCLPLSGTFVTKFEISFWCDMMSAILGSRNMVPRMICWPNEINSLNSNRFYLFMGNPDPSLLLPIVEPLKEHHNLWDLTACELEFDHACQELPKEIIAVVDSNCRTLGDLLDAISTIV